MRCIENNVEAFRYYLAFEIWTISTNQDNSKIAPTLVSAIYLPVDRWTIYLHKAWDHFLLLVSGQSRASNAMIDDGSHASFLVNLSEEQEREY